MKPLRVLLPLIAAGIILAALISVSLRPATLLVVAPTIVGVALAVFGVLSLVMLKRGTAIAPGALPGLLVTSMSFASLFVETGGMRIALAVITVILFFVLVRHLSESVRGERFTEAIAALSEWSAVMVIFGAAAGLLAAVTFLTFPVWGAMLIFVALAAFVSLTLSRLLASPLWIAGISALLLFQGFAFLQTLPVSHWVSAALIAAIAYVLFSLSRGLAAVRIRKTLLYASAAGAVILVTARWR